MGHRPEYDFRVIGQNLKKYRQKKGLTVENVRIYMQLGTVQSIYKWERGDGLPQADTLLALMDLYDVHTFDAITEESEELSSVLLFDIKQYSISTHIFYDNCWLLIRYNFIRILSQLEEDTQFYKWR